MKALASLDFSSSAPNGDYERLNTSSTGQEFTQDEAYYERLNTRGVTPRGDDGSLGGTPRAFPDDVVQFFESVAIVNSDEGKLEVAIMRIGRNKGSCKCSWKTVEGSAKAGKHFMDSSGVITMEEGVSSALISVPILCDPHWNATTEFRLVLDDAENCTLGLYLKIARVKIIDANVFPSNDFRSQVPPMSPEMPEDVSELGLFLSFFKLMWHQDGVQWRTIVLVMFGVLHNLYEYMSLIISVYLVDKVFNFNDDEQMLLIPGNRLLTVYVIGLALLIPQVLFFVLRHAENYMDLDGRVRSSLSRSLFSKFMNYSARSREEVPLSDMVNALFQVSGFSRGYTRALHMCRSVGSIVVAIIFTLHANPGAWKGIVAVPCVMALWILLRTRKFIKASEANDDKESRLLAFSNMSLSKMTVISAYRQRPQMNDYFEEKVQDVQKQAVASKTVEVNNEGVPMLLGPMLVAVYTLLGASLVLNHELGLGVFLATIKVFGDICDSFAELYEVMMSIIRTFPVLKGLTQVLNMTTELPALKSIAKKTVEMTVTKRNAMAQGAVPRVDRMEIEVRDVSFSYMTNEGPSKPIFENLSAKAEQGQIVALKAKSGFGRKTLLDLLAGAIYPTSGLIFIPSHLRVLLISREVFILDLSIWANVTFGNRMGNNPHRVERILNFFNMHVILNDSQFQKDLQKRKEEFNGLMNSGEVLETGPSFMNTEEEGELDENSKRSKGKKRTSKYHIEKINPMMKFNETGRALLHLIRGFVMNPEVMLLHRPFVHFHDNDVIGQVERALQDQTSNRGFQMPANSRSTRRPRTVFMSCDSHSNHEKIADLIWELPTVLGQRVDVRSLQTQKGRPKGRVHI